MGGTRSAMCRPPTVPTRAVSDAIEAGLICHVAIGRRWAVAAHASNRPPA